MAVPHLEYIYINNHSFEIAVNFTWELNATLFDEFTINQNGQVEFNKEVIYYQGVAVLSTDNPIENAQYFTIIDLTNTKWVLNSSLGNTSFLKNITFVSNGSIYYSIYRSYELPLHEDWLDYGSTGVYNNEDGWVDQAYRLISITGGTDATNVDLISWLMSNATQVPVVDLTNTKWVIKDYPDQLTYGYEFNFISNNTNFTQMMGSAGNDAWNFGYYSSSWLTVYDGSWLDNAYKTISITNGTDTTNPDLIAWLSQNATLQQIPIISRKKLLKINNKNIFKLNNKVVDTFNGTNVFSGVSSGFSGSIDVYVYRPQEITTYTKIKFDTPPVDDNDYDAYADPNIDNAGTITGLTSYSNKRKIYVWGSYSRVFNLIGGGYTDISSNCVKINNVETQGGVSYDTAVEVILTGNYTIYLGYYSGGSSN